MTVRIGNSELSRKGIRYRATENGEFTLTASARIPAGRAIAANNFLDLAILAPGVSLQEVVLVPSGSLEDSGGALTCQLRAYDFVTAVPTSHTTGLDATNLVPTADITWRNTAVLPIRLVNTGTNGASTFAYTPVQPTSFDPQLGTTAANLNVTIPNPAPRAFPLTQARIPPQTGTRLIRLLFPAAPSVQTVAAATNRVITAHFLCVASTVNTATQLPYGYADRRDNVTLVSST